MFLVTFAAEVQPNTGAVAVGDCGGNFPLWQDQPETGELGKVGSEDVNQYLKEIA